MASGLVASESTLPVRISRWVLGMRVDHTSYADATRRCLAWAKAGESRYVCVSTVHMVMESYDAPAFRQVVNGADLVTPDGMPLVWALRLLGVKGATRTYGPALTPALLAEAAREGIRVGFYGGTEESLAQLLRVVHERYPGIQVSFAYSPPFRPLTPDEDEWVTQGLNRSGTQILFVGIGCPKQERWMAAHRGRVQAVMLGVGAAFDFLIGAKPQAPPLMQSLGLEWLFRLITEPRRLWRRYLKHNPRFLLFFLMQLLGLRRFSTEQTGL